MKCEGGKKRSEAKHACSCPFVKVVKVYPPFILATVTRANFALPLTGTGAVLTIASDEPPHQLFTSKNRRFNTGSGHTRVAQAQMHNIEWMIVCLRHFFEMTGRLKRQNYIKERKHI